MMMTAGAFIHYHAAFSPATNTQRQVIEAVHRMFPVPVAYLDRCSMISSFPQAGLFLSSWGIEDYRNTGRPIMREMLAERQPKFLIANSPFLAEAFAPAASGERAQSLFAEDREVLEGNFIHHWGPVFVAGKQVIATDREQLFDLLIGGPYTVESTGPLLIDGRRYAPGDVLALRPGTHRFVSPAGAQRLLLRWGDRLARPDVAAPDAAMFGDF